MTYMCLTMVGGSVIMSLSLNFHTHKIGLQTSFQDDQKQPLKITEHNLA